MTDWKTADLCDDFPSLTQIAAPLLQDYGGLTSFCGKIVIVQAFDDNTLVKEMLAKNGKGQVLVVDGGASTRCALVGDLLAQKGCDNSWSGIVVNGCIRDSEAISKIAIGVKAINTVPNKSSSKGMKNINIPVSFAGVMFHPNHYLYSDEDGIVLADQDLLHPKLGEKQK